MAYRGNHTITLDEPIYDLLLKLRANVFYRSKRMDWRAMTGEKIISAVLTNFLLAHRSEIEDEYREVFNAIQQHKARRGPVRSPAAKTAVLLAEAGSDRGVDRRSPPPLPYVRGAR